MLHPHIYLQYDSMTLTNIREFRQCDTLQIEIQALSILSMQCQVKPRDKFKQTFHLG